MIPSPRRRYNAAFSSERYEQMLDWIAEAHGHRPPFRIAETPIFVPADFRAHLLNACEDVLRVITAPDFGERSAGALLPEMTVPGETPHTTFLQMDFGICRGESGELTPQLIEAQGFPSLYFYQDLIDRAYRRFFPIPEDFTTRFHGLSAEAYHEMLRRIIVGHHDPENVILLEIEPYQQPTAIDFYVTRDVLGIAPVCISELRLEGRQLFYEKDGKQVPVHRIYNRVIFDELAQRRDLPRQFNLTEDVDVEWIGHPNWFFRISKHTLPFIDSPYVPDTRFLSDVDPAGEDLSRYVLKPLYSFAGSGVLLHPTVEDLEAVADPQHYILQRKVEYVPVIETPDVNAKAEVRMMFLWERGAPRPVLVNNLVRLSKGEMIGVKFNKNKTWVGGSIGYFEP